MGRLDGRMKVRKRDGTGVEEFRYVTEDVDRHGNVRLYVRKPGKAKVRLYQMPGTDAFREEYQAALNAPVAPPRLAKSKPATIRWLSEQYQQAAPFKAMNEVSRKLRRAILESICDEVGNLRYALMKPINVAKIRDKAASPSAANDRVSALRQMFKWACSPECRLAEVNPAVDIAYLPARNPEGYHSWSVDEVRRYEATHAIGTRARLAMALLLYTGTRRSDAISLGKQHERDGVLHFTEVKGRARKPKLREIPILPELRAAIDACPSDTLTYLVNGYGQPYSNNGFSNRMRRWCDEAGLPHCSAHGLRKAGATIAADNGATEFQLMSIFGWDSPAQAAIYTRKANRNKMAREGMHLVSPAQKMNISVPLSQGQSKWDNRRKKKA